MPHKNLVSILLEKNYIFPEQAEELKKEAANLGKTIDELLEEKNLVSEEAVTGAKSELYQIPSVSLAGKMISKDILNIISQELAESYQAVAFEKQGQKLSMALRDPSDLKAREAIDYIARENNLEIEYYVATPTGIKGILKQYKGLVVEVEKALTQAQQQISQLPQGAAQMEKGFEEMVKSEPVSKMVAAILEHAIEERASDVHIEPVLNQTRVRFRVDGVLKTSLTLPQYIHSAIVSRIKVLSNLRIDETRVPQDGRFRTEIKDKAVDLRVSTFPLMGSEKVVMRVLDVSQGVPTLENLGFWGKGLEILLNGLKKKNGMILVTGPTGSGKTTTLYSLLNIVNKEGSNIITIEDPVEYYLNGVNQSQINTEVGLTFSSGLRSILRQDPDIIMVGEVRDNETAELGTRAALTGHLVLSTLHTRDVLGAFPRLLDMKVDSFLIPATVNVVVAQRLARKLCEKCREKTTVPKKLEAELKEELSKIPESYFGSHKEDLLNKDKELSFYKAKGCPQCEHTGYKGRLAIFELISMSDELEKIITSDFHHEDLEKEFKRQEMISLKQDGLIKALRGLTSLEEIFGIIEE